MKVNGDSFSKRELLRRAGGIEQIADIRPVQYFSGDANLVKAYDIDTGGGLEFSVNENKCLDIFKMKYKGINLGFASKAGLHSPYNADQRNTSFLYSQGCGMLYTAGLANVGGACADEGDEQYGHGRVKNIAARNVSARGIWDKDEYRIKISGDMHEAAFFGRNLVLHREIETMAGSRSIHITDTVENLDFKEDGFMLLYHLNTGYPLLDEGAEYVTSIRRIEPMSDISREHLKQAGEISAPLDNVPEDLYCIEAGCDMDGYGAACLVNRTLMIGLYVKFRVDQLPYMVEWKSMKAGDYALGMLPANCRPIGRLAAKEQHDLKMLKPFESCTMELEIGILDGEKELEKFLGYIAAMK